MKKYFSEIREICKNPRLPNEKKRQEAKKRWDSRTKPLGSLGRMEEWVEHLAAWQNNGPKISNPKIAVFIGSHGVANQNVSAYPSSVNEQMLANIQKGGAAINQLALAASCDFQVYEMNIATPTGDISETDAMGLEECYNSMCYGMTAIDGNVDVVCLGEIGIGNTTSAAALAYSLYGGKAKDWVGFGSGIDEKTLARKIEIVERAVARAGADISPLEKLQKLGGREIAAIAGAIIAARKAGCVVILDGFVSTVAGAVLACEEESMLDHCLVATLSQEKGHKKLCDKLKIKPEFDLGLRLGEASGAALMVPLLKSSLALWSDMASFEDGVDTTTIVTQSIE